MADAVAAVVARLTGEPGVDRVFGVQLPRAEHAAMPRQAVLVRGAGGAGTFGGGYLPVVDDRVDVRCYGATEWDAAVLSETVSRLLHHTRDAATAQGRIIWARRSSGGVAMVEPDTAWPLVLTSWQVLGDWLETPT